MTLDLAAACGWASAAYLAARERRYWLAVPMTLMFGLHLFLYAAATP